MSTPAILRDFPDSFTTARLLIRSPLPGDGPEFNAAIRDSLEGLQQWLHLYPDGPPTVEESEEFIRRQHIRFLAHDKLMLLVLLKESPTLVASSGLFDLKWDVPSFEIGYWGRATHRGQGYVTEAVKGITAFAFDILQAERVTILCDVDNHASIAVARRAGFELEATQRNDRRNAAGELSNTHVFARLRNQSPTT